MTARHVAMYSGSFDPITHGHLDVVARARLIFDEVVVAIGRNPDKPALFSFDERLAITRTLLDDLVATHPEGATVRVTHYTGLTVDYARELNAVALIRGIRNITDLAMETQLAITNRKVAGIETVFIVTGEEYAYTSSSLIKQVAALGGDLDRLRSLIPDLVIEGLREKRSDPSNPLGELRRLDQLVD